MRGSIGLMVACGLIAAGCGDGINDASAHSPRGVIDGVTLDTAAAVDLGTAPPDTGSLDSVPDDTEPEDTAVDSEPVDGAIDWSELDQGVQEGSFEVPLDHDDPDGEAIDLYLVRHQAADRANRIGTLLVNPGGPGFGGSDMAWFAESTFDEELLDRFDIVGWDPRGTGYSDPYVDCIDDYDRHFGVDSSPDTAEEREALVDLAATFADSCVDRSGDFLEFVSTEDTARDMDLIRQALGEDQISYFGFSYGSELGATWATLFPDTVRAAVLDGAVDPTVGYLQQNVQQAAGFEAAFNAFLEQSAGDERCAFHHDGDPGAAFDALSAAIDAAPVEVESDRTPVTQGVLMAAISNSLYDEASWPQLAQALAALEQGDGRDMLDLYDAYYGYLGGASWTDSLEAYFAINCLDDPGSTGPDDLFSHEAEFAAAAPRLGRSWMLELSVCSMWPVGPAGTVEIDGRGAGPILVVGTTGDSATPLDGTRRMAERLEDGRLVVVAANQHTGYGVNPCGDELIVGYLLDPTAPLAEFTDCT